MSTRERLRRTPVVELSPGDQFVKPDYLQVYAEDKAGYASLMANAGVRFTVIDRSADTLTASRDDGAVLSQAFLPGQSVLKVVQR